MRPTLMLLFVIAVASTGFNPADDPPFTVVTIPFNEKDKTQIYLTFDVEIDGKKFNALYDTGSPTPARILKTSAAKSGIDPQSGKFDIKIGDVVVKGISIKTVDKFNTNYPKDIILGYGVLNKVYTVVDYPSHRALFTPCSETTSYADADRIAKKQFGEVQSEFALPLIIPEGHILVEATVQGKKLHFAVDTGWLGFNILTTAGINALGVGEKFTRLDFTVDGHDFNKILFKNTRVGALEGSVATYKKFGLTFGGILGVPDFLGHYRVGIDYKEKKLHLGAVKSPEAK